MKNVFCDGKKDAEISISVLISYTFGKQNASPRFTFAIFLKFIVITFQFKYSDIERRFSLAYVILYLEMII